MENENKKLKELSEEFFKKNTKPTKNDLYEFLVKNQFEIYNDYDRNNHNEKLIDELKNLGYKTDKIPSDLIDLMLEQFEDLLYDDHYRWVDCLNETISKYEEDLEEYKGDFKNE